MAGYKPLYISGNQTGLVQDRQNFLLPDDAYPVLENAYVFRERILRKQGSSLLGRLQRNIGTTNGSGNATITIAPLPIQSGIASFTVGTQVFQDPGGTSPVTLLTNGPGTASLNRSTGVLTITGSIATTAVQYFPGLPGMGVRTEELQNSRVDRTIFFDQNYAYNFNASTSIFQEFITGTTWNKHGADVTGIDFFFSTNYWVSGTANSPFSTTNFKLFWVTNNTGANGSNMDPVRITDGSQWIDFNSGTWNQIDAGPTYLVNWLCMLPFRGRLVVFNTYEGTANSGAGALNYSNRIRWCNIGNPFIAYDAGPPAVGSWRDDIRGKGGFLDIPTSEDIVSIGFVRDNLVIYCERSTWQLRYTGRSIAPFQVERVNSELGNDSTFSTIQFDTSLMGIGDKGIVECDSYKSERIDIKIPDFVYQFNTTNNGVQRVQGIRDFPARLAYWTCCLSGYYDGSVPSASRIFPNVRLVYNYENDSWATFTDSYTAIGNYQSQTSRTWLNTKRPWIECNFPWINFPQGSPKIAAINQQGFVEIISGFEEFTVNDISLFISDILGNDTTSTLVTSPNHNLITGSVIEISGVQSTDPFVNLNGGVYGIVTGDSSNNNAENCFRLFKYNPVSLEFDINQLDSSSNIYQGGALIKVRDNFNITSKKFNFTDQGQNIQLGYVDILMPSTGNSTQGAINLNVYLDYDDVNASNTLPQNNQAGSPGNGLPDLFFNATIPTTQPTISTIGGSKFWHRVFCATRASFLTLQYSFSNAQMAGNEQKLDVQIDAQILWTRPGGRLSSY